MFKNFVAFYLSNPNEMLLFLVAIAALLFISAQVANRIAIRQRGEHGGGLLALSGFTVLISGCILLVFIHFFYSHSVYAPAIWFKSMPPHEKAYFQHKTANDKQLNDVRLPISIYTFVHLENEYKRSGKQHQEK